MKCIVGLGNLGEKYEETRHNLGFVIIEHFLKDTPLASAVKWLEDTKFKCLITTLTWRKKEGEEEKVILVKPQTNMNNSGMAVQLVSSYYKIDSSDIWVVYDELDLPIGSMKIRFGGAAAGHHGVESIIEELNTDKFWRFRMGIGASSHHSAIRDEEKRPTISRHFLGDVSDYVLGTFTSTEKGKVKELIKHGSQALQLALESGMEVAMNRFNTK